MLGKITIKNRGSSLNYRGVQEYCRDPPKIPPFPLFYSHNAAQGNPHYNHDWLCYKTMSALFES